MGDFWSKPYVYNSAATTTVTVDLPSPSPYMSSPSPIMNHSQVQKPKRKLSLRKQALTKITQFKDSIIKKVQKPGAPGTKPPPVPKKDHTDASESEYSESSYTSDASDAPAHHTDRVMAFTPLAAIHESQVVAESQPIKQEEKDAKITDFEDSDFSLSDISDPGPVKHISNPVKPKSHTQINVQQDDSELLSVLDKLESNVVKQPEEPATISNIQAEIQNDVLVYDDIDDFDD